MADSRVGIDGFAAAAARGFKYERLDYPRHLTVSYTHLTLPTILRV